LVRWPNAATKHHNEAASSSQFSEAHSSDQAITRLSLASRENELAASRTARSTLSPFRKGILSPATRSTREAKPAPRMMPSTSTATPASTIVPIMATVA
jgi:hypothetical protein